MKLGDKILRLIILFIGVIIVIFNILLYNTFEKQRIEMNAMKDKLDVESEFNSNKFKYHEEKIDRLNRGLEIARGHIKEQQDAMADQKDALLQEVEKRQQVEDQNRQVQTSLVDIKAEADAIKQDMKGWQKDYVNVLAQLEKKMDESQEETKSIENNLVSLNIPELKENINSLKVDIEKITHPVDNNILATNTDAAPVPEKKEQNEY